MPKEMVARVRGASNLRYRQALLESQEEISRRVLQREKQVKDSWCAEVTEKYEPYESIPFKICGACGQYLEGHGKQKAKKTVRECFAEYQSITDPSHITAIMKFLFSIESVVSKQLYDFGIHPTSDLHDYTEAWIAVQEYSFGLSVGKYLEGEHARLRGASTRGLQMKGPAYTNARKRFPQIDKALEDPAEMDYLCQKWDSRTASERLLKHMVKDGEVSKLTLAQKHAKFYQYDLGDQCTADEDEEVQQTTAMMVLMNQAQVTPPVAVVPSGALMIEWWKNKMEQGSVFSVRTDFYQMALSSTHLADTMQSMAIARVLDTTEPADNASVATQTFFEVVHPRPENKVHLRRLHAAKQRHSVNVMVLQATQHGEIVSVEQTASEHVVLDLSQRCGEERFTLLNANLFKWDAAYSQLTVKMLA